MPPQIGMPQIVLVVGVVLLVVALARRFRRPARQAPVFVNPYASAPAAERPRLIDLFIEHEDEVRLARRRSRASDRIFDLMDKDDSPNA